MTVLEAVNKALEKLLLAHDEFRAEARSVRDLQKAYGNQIADMSKRVQEMETAQVQFQQTITTAQAQLQQAINTIAQNATNGDAQLQQTINAVADSARNTDAQLQQAINASVDSTRFLVEKRDFLVSLLALARYDEPKGPGIYEIFYFPNLIAKQIHSIGEITTEDHLREKTKPIWERE